MSVTKTGNNDLLESLYEKRDPQPSSPSLEAQQEMARRVSQISDRIAYLIQESQPLSNFRIVPPDQLYKLFIDACRWERAQKRPYQALDFDEREPGYMMAMMQAFLTLMGHPTELSPDFIEHLHDTAVMEVQCAKTAEALKTKFRERQEDGNLVAVRFEVFASSRSTPLPTMTPQGVEELKQKMKDPSYQFTLEDDPNVYHAIKDNVRFIETPAGGIISLRPVPSTFLRASVQRLIDKYHKDLHSAQDEQGRLKVIVTFIQNLDQIHPFSDGNIRTFAILLLNKLLVDNGMRPTCLEDPNCFDCLSIAQIMSQVMQGQNRLQSIH